jgi:hypothetical protein
VVQSIPQYYNTKAITPTLRTISSKRHVSLMQSGIQLHARKHPLPEGLPVTHPSDGCPTTFHRFCHGRRRYYSTKNLNKSWRERPVEPPFSDQEPRLAGVTINATNLPWEDILEAKIQVYGPQSMEKIEVGTGLWADLASTTVNNIHNGERFKQYVLLHLSFSFTGTP